MSAAVHTEIGFQSTLPVWGATDAIIHKAMAALISIHAPRVGSDLVVVRLVV